MPELKYLVMVTAENNNKFYRMIPHGDTFTAEYGRLGNSSFQTKEYPISKFNTIYNQKISKGYADHTDLIEEAIEIEKPKNKKEEYKPIKDNVVARIVERLQLMAKKTIEANYKVKASIVTNAMIKKAQDCLNKLSTVKTVPTFNKYLLELFSILPRKMSHVDDFLAKSTSDFSDILTKEQDLLDVMAGQVFTLSKTNEAEEKSTDDEIEASKTILETMGIEIEQTTDEEKEHIKKMLGSISPRFINAWKVKNIKTQERFDEYHKQIGLNKEVKELWHGSRNENWWSIITNGLVLRPTNAVITGKMFGYGLYFAPKAAKSIGYTSTYGSRWASGNSSSGFLSIYDVLYGDPFIVNKNYYSYSGLGQLNYESLQQRQKGADSLHALKDVTGLREDEIIVYKEEQATIKYLVEVKS